LRGPQTRRAHGPQPGHWRSDPDQGQQESRVSRRQRSQGSGLASRYSCPWPVGSRPGGVGPSQKSFGCALLCPLLLPSGGQCFFCCELEVKRLVGGDGLEPPTLSV